MPNKNKPIIQCLTDFLDYCEIEKGLADKTQKNYHRFLNKFFKWLLDNRLGSLKPSQLSPDYIWKYRVYLSRNKSFKTNNILKKSTQNLYLIALRALLEYFAEKNIISLSPTKIKLVKDKGDKEIKFLKLDQIGKLLLAPNVKIKIGLRDRVILEVLRGRSRFLVCWSADKAALVM